VVQCVIVCCDVLFSYFDGLLRLLNMSTGSGRAVRVAVCCSVLQCAAVCYSVLQCVVMRCDVSFSHPAAFCVC